MFDHIAKLLESHNCVIIPGFGGFVADYRPAQLHPVSHEFTPPSKSLAFNPLLTNNDGLLSQYVASTEGISFEAAEEKVRKFGKQCDASLREQKSLKCTGLGKLVMDLEKKLQFHPDITRNLLGNAFGLTSFVSKPVTRSKKQAIIEQQKAIAETAPLKEQEVPTRRIGGLQIAWGVAAAVLIGILVIQLVADKPLQNMQYSDWQFWNRNTETTEPAEARRFDPPVIIESLQEQMRSFGKTRSEAPAPKEVAEAVATQTTKVDEAKETAEKELTSAEAKAPVSSPKEANAPAKAEPIKKSPVKATEPVANNTPTTAKADRNADLPLFQDTPRRGYYCIIGSYLNKAQAQKRLSRLPDGNHGQAILHGRNGYFRAGIFIHADEMTAELQLRKLRNEYGQSDAWIVKY